MSSKWIETSKEAVLASFKATFLLLVCVNSENAKNVTKIKKPYQNFRCQNGHVTRFHSEDTQILDATVQNLVPQETWRPGGVLHCVNRYEEFI
jgi:hypothetical protein